MSSDTTPLFALFKRAFSIETHLFFFFSVKKVAGGTSQILQGPPDHSRIATEGHHHQLYKYETVFR